LKYLISYDIIDDRRRAVVCRIALGFGYRVQKSVFEGFSSKEYLESMKEKFMEVINKEEDSIRIYPICCSCSEKVEILGQGRVVEKVNYIII
jgi:CRISPR-associated protein Cas2